MTDLTVSPALLNASAPRVVPERMRQTAEDFEASVLTQMLKPMFDSLSTEAPFGGGEAESTWRGFLVEAMAKQTVKAGGLGLSDTIVSEMIKMQEQAQ